MPGKKTIPTIKKANSDPGPITAAAKDGRTNRPEPILAATVTIITPIRDKERLIVLLTSETTPEISLSEFFRGRFYVHFIFSICRFWGFITRLF